MDARRASRREEMRRRILAAALARQHGDSDVGAVIADEGKTNDGSLASPTSAVPKDATVIDLLSDDDDEITFVAPGKEKGSVQSQPQAKKEASLGKRKLRETAFGSSNSSQGYQSKAARREESTLVGPATLRGHTPADGGSRRLFHSNYIYGIPKSDNENAVTLESLFVRGTARVTHALLMGMAVDVQWLRTFLPPPTPITVVQSYPKETQAPGHFSVDDCTSILFPKLPFKYSTFHIKLCLIVFPDCLRVVISTANLTELEWKQVDQLVWYQDFPLLVGAPPSEFRDVLVDVLSALDLSSKFLSKFDFSDVEVDLVASVPGRHTGDRLERFGQYRIRQLLAKQDHSVPRLPISSGGTLLYKCSSVGSLNQGYYRSFVKCFGGPKYSRKDLEVQLAYPTTAQVAEIPAQYRFSEFLHLRSHALSQLPAGILHKLTPRSASRKKLIAHYKVACKTSTDGAVEWVYIGSHNLSQSAWGIPEKGTLRINSYELGVFIRPRAPEMLAPKGSVAPTRVPTAARLARELPFMLPAEPYGPFEQPYTS